MNCTSATVIQPYLCLLECGGAMTADTIAPSPPTNLKLSNDEDRTARIAWSAPTSNINGSRLTDLAGYVLAFRDISTNEAWIEIDLGDVTANTINNLRNDHVYQFRVKAYDSAKPVNYSDWSQNASIQLKDKVKPTIRLVPVSSAEVFTEINICAQITDNEAVKTSRIYYKNISSRDWSYAQIEQDKICDHAIIPAAAVRLGAIQYYIDATDNSGNCAHLPLEAPDTNYLINVYDPTSPNIVHTPIKRIYIDEDFKVTARITDNVEVKDATLYYRIYNANPWQSYKMKEENGIYSAAVPKNRLSLYRAEYYIEAVDSSNNRSAEPADAPREFHRVQVQVNDKHYPYQKQ